MIYLTIIQSNILAIALIIIFSILIYVILQWIKKEHKHAQKTKFMMLDNVITYKNVCDLIEYRIRQNHQVHFSLMMLTIDHFDQILDYADASSTTQYIKRVAKLLEMVLPVGAKLAQTDDRETFIVYLPELYDKEIFLNLASSFKQMIEKRIELDDGTYIEKSSSIALITYPEQANTLKELIEALKTAIYSIKRKGGGHLSFYSADMIEEKENYEQYQIIKSAIKDKQITMKFIPVFHKERKIMVALETELVWTKANKIETFKHFMPNLEASHDIYWFGLWMLEKTLSAHLGIYTMSYNQNIELIIPVGVRQFEQEEVVSDMMQILDKYQLAPEKLIIKIINPLQVNQETRLIKSLLELQSYGIKLAIDIQKIDEHLYYLLNEYKINIILINEQLLTKTHDKTIEVEELLTFARSHKIDLVATMIKNKDQVLKLDEHVERIQGPYMSAPLTKDEILNQMNKKLDI